MQMTLEEFLHQDGRDLDELVADLILDGTTVPALCREGCEVEPDGECPHGCPSVLLAMGVI